MVTGCPKRMVFGPCGGVRTDGGCEMRPGLCVFDDVVGWAGDAVAPPDVPAAPMVLTDLSVPPADAAALAATARMLADSCDAVLVGDHQDRPDFSPSLLARLIRDAGAVPWVTLACRDRNRIVLEQELRTLLHDGPVTVLCVTGDGRAFDVRPDVTQVFDLDGTRLAALAASLGVRVAVAESPASPPVHRRPFRLLQKQLAGAAVAVLNHSGPVASVAGFVAQARRAGLTIPVIAPVAVFTDALSVQALGALPGLELDPAGVQEVLDSADPVSTGIGWATAQARELLAVDGVAGVNLSGLASGRGPAFAAEVQAEIGRSIRREHAGGPGDGGRVRHGRELDR